VSFPSGVASRKPARPRPPVLETIVGCSPKSSFIASEPSNPDMTRLLHEKGLAGAAPAMTTV
jgi:hypothetical protein